MIGLLGFAGIAALAKFRHWPRGLGWIVAGFWWLLLVSVHAPPLAGNPVARLVGGEFRGWAALGFIGLAVLGYRKLFARLRPPAAAVATGAAPASPPGSAFRPAELERYSRHILLHEIGGPGQQRLKAARVLVVGAGGLGSPALLYLAASGVGTIGVIDPDSVEGSNLQRQIIHADARIGMPKVFSAETAMRALNPFITIRPYHRAFERSIAADLLAEYDLVLDGTDRFDTRSDVNVACVRAGTPLISAAITQWEGQIGLFDPASGGPCYACVFPVAPAPGLVPTCAEAGVAAPLPGILGSMMAMEAIKHLTGAGETLEGRLLMHDALSGETRLVRTPRNPDCPICRQPARVQQ